MLISAKHLSKQIGAKTLFTDLNLHIENGEKVALIGRNGQGKSTILNILGERDHDFLGQISRQKGLVTVLTSQEHLNQDNTTPLEYILQSVPHYLPYKKALNDYEKGRHKDLELFSKALEYFITHDYYQIEARILNTLADFQLPQDLVNGPFSSLSGGEKRFVELVRMMYARADLLLIDEPTNHMDYLGKDRFISWLDSLSQGVLVVTHDRDVLSHVTRIIELKDGKIYSFPGNYEAYLKQNTLNTTSSVTLYQNQLRRLAEAKKKVDWGLQMRAKSKAWKIRYDHWKRDYDKIKAETVKPSFWIDQDSVADLDRSITDSYHKFKEKNVQIASKTEKQRYIQLLKVKGLSLGYQSRLFNNKSFTLNTGDIVFIKGRNGAGKSTLVKTIISKHQNQVPTATIFNGEIQCASTLRIGEYTQEISPIYLKLTLEQAIQLAYKQHNLEIDDSTLKKTLSQYLFDPKSDGKQMIANLSGGQKARFQLIKMFANSPNLLILDEPTNHLDLPSIEELENALSTYQGGIIYISHDSHFIKKLKGEIVTI